MSASRSKSAVELVIVENEADFKDPLADDNEFDSDEEATMRLQLQDNVNVPEFTWQKQSPKHGQTNDAAKSKNIIKEESISDDDSDESQDRDFQCQDEPDVILEIDDDVKIKQVKWWSFSGDFGKMMDFFFALFQVEKEEDAPKPQTKEKKRSRKTSKPRRKEVNEKDSEPDVSQPVVSGTNQYGFRIPWE